MNITSSKRSNMLTQQQINNAEQKPQTEDSAKQLDLFSQAKEDFAMFEPSDALKKWAADAEVKTIPQMFEVAMAKDPDANFLGKKVDGKFEYISYAETNRQRKTFASGLVSLGVLPGERVATYAENSPDWMVGDLGSITAGAVHAPLYRDSKADAVAFNLKNSKTKVVIVDDESRLNELLKVEDSLPELHTIIVKNKEGVESSKRVVSWDEVMATGAENLEKNTPELEHRAKNMKATDVASIVFTSGTTGTPKAVLHTHGSLLSSAEGALKVITNDHDTTIKDIHLKGDSELALLPLGHIFERIVAYSLTAGGAALAYPNGHKEFLDDVKQTQPTVLAAVPKLYNKIMEGARDKAHAKQLVSKPTGYLGGALGGAAVGALIGGGSGLLSTVLAGGDVVSSFLGGMGPVGAAIGGLAGLGIGAYAASVSQGDLFDWALDTSEQYYKERDNGDISTLTNIKHGVAKKLVYGKSKKSMEGVLGKNVRGMISGGAPLPDRTSAFFWENGIELSNGYGTSEMGVTNVNPLGGQKFGTVGPAVPGVEMVITPDADFKGQQGEIRFRGPNLMLGYLNDPEKTAKAFDEEGFYLTGDIGETDATDYLKITGRLKNYIVLASGKKIASEPLEQMLEQSPYIEQSLVVGESRPHVGALVIPNFEKLGQWAKENGHSSEPSEMAKNPAVKDFLQSETRRLTADNDRHEQIWKIGVIGRDLKEEEMAKGEPKRPVLLKNFAGLVDSIYIKK